MALDCIRMSSKEFTKKELLDYGGFGKVSLCLHETHGFVVLKTVYTGPLCTDSQALLDEGEIMNRLNHERIVKLLGVILEEGNHALVMEYIPKGNLLMMLKNVSVPISIKGRIILEIIEGMAYLNQNNIIHKDLKPENILIDKDVHVKVSVPISIKGRIILEIIEGMAYLNQNNIIHKDLKPENILIDKDVHVKIADLGLATCKAWSKLTKEESRRQSRSHRKAQSNTGTLYYMAPEHLDSIHTRATEKSDVYSFGIVVWVILANKEPYENAHNEDHVYHSVCKGDRPDLNDIPVSTPEEITNLMKLCWDADPTKRPTFTDCFKEFRPFYTKHLTKDVERDLENLRKEYEGPEDFLEKMKSLTLETTQDHPSSLRSSQELPVETSIEDIIFSSNSSIQMDAAPAENLLQQKLDGEYKYHKYGSRMDQQESQHASGSRLDPLREERNRRVSNNPSYEKASTGESAARNKEGPERERYLGLSSPEEPKVFPNTSDINQKTEVKAQPCNYPGMYNSPGTVGPVPGSPYSYGMGAPFPYNPEFQRMYSLPAGFPVPESDATQGMPFSPITLYPPQDKGTGNWIINNASGVQIGNYNHLSIGNQTISSEPCQSSPQSNCPVEMIQMFEPHQSPVTKGEPHQSPVTEGQLHQSPEIGDLLLLPPPLEGDYLLLPPPPLEGDYLLLPPPPLEGDYLLLPPPPLEGDYLLLPPPPLEGDYLLLPPPPLEGDYLLLPPPPLEGDYLLLPPPPLEGDYLLLPPPPLEGDYLLLPHPPLEGDYLLLSPPLLEGDYLPLPPPPLEGDYLPLPHPPLEGDYLLLPPPPLEGDYLLLPPPPLEGDYLLLPPPPPEGDYLLLPPPQRGRLLAAPASTARGLLVALVSTARERLPVAPATTTRGAEATSQLMPEPAKPAPPRAAKPAPPRG
ncbi:UNVERIFIED_CONTAM: hypothetical protein FKN15_074818 [Acipenser sinensis]